MSSYTLHTFHSRDICIPTISSASENKQKYHSIAISRTYSCGSATGGMAVTDINTLPEAYTKDRYNIVLKKEQTV